MNRFEVKRKSKSDEYIKALNLFTLGLIKGEMQESFFINLITSVFKKIEKSKNNDQEFSGFSKYIFDNFDEYVNFHIDDKEIQNEIINAFEYFNKNEPIKTLYFEKLAANNLLSTISNTMSITGDGNISLQDINASAITVNYNDTGKIKEIITKFNQSQKTEHRYIAIELEKFF